jgi:hypothetical protein
MAAAGLALGTSVHARNYWILLPGLVIFGVGLALVLMVNDPVCLDTLPEQSHGQASGVSATVEQFGGAVGISVLYLLFHATYVSRLHGNINASPSKDLTSAQYAQLRDDIVAAEQTGLRPTSSDPRFAGYLRSALDASNWGYTAAFFATSLLAIGGLLAVWRLVRAPSARSSPPPLDVESDQVHPRPTERHRRTGPGRKSGRDGPEAHDRARLA